MKAADQFHVGIVVDDIDSMSAELSALFGYEWTAEIGGPATVCLPAGDQVLDLRARYSTSAPRLEIVHSIPGTMWTPVAGSGIHHVGYWSDDVAADSAELEQHGCAVEAVGRRPDGAPYWAFHRTATGPRIELVARMIQPVMEQMWTTEGQPS